MARLGSFIFLFLLLSLQNLIAQKDDFTPFSEVGVKTSLNMAKAYISEDDEGSGFKGPGLSVRYLHMQTKHMGFLAEVNYNWLSFSLEDTDYSYSFVNIPFMTRARFPLGKKSDFALNAGSYLQMVLDHHEDVVFDRNTLFGLAGGIDYGFMFGNTRISLEGRYHYNLHSSSENVDNLRSGWFEVGLGFGFRFFGKKQEQ